MLSGDPRPKPISFPSLTILPQAPPISPPLTQSEKYGGLYILGIAGLVVVVALVGWFGWRAWSLRGVWGAIYKLHDGTLPVGERVDAAAYLAREPGLDDLQRWEIALRKPLPDPARYLLAESLDGSIAASEPGGFARVVAFSEGWPGWLRLLGVRAMALAATRGTTFPAEPLDRLATEPDPFLASLLAYTRALGRSDQPGIVTARDRLHELAGLPGPPGAFAARLVQLVEPEVDRSTRLARLAELTRDLRSDDPAALVTWAGWHERDGRWTRIDP